MASAGCLGSMKLDAIPVVLLIQALGDGEIVQTVSGIGIDTSIDHGGEHGSRDRGGYPIFGIEVSLRDGGAVCSYFRRGEHVPSGGHGPLAGAIRLKNLLSRRGLGDWTGEWSFAAGHGRGILRCAVSRLAPGLHGPRLRALFKFKTREIVGLLRKMFDFVAA